MSLNDKYNIVDTEEKLRELDAILMDGDAPRFKLLGFDTETNGLELYKTTVVGFSIAFNKHHGFYVPILQWVPDESTRYERSFEKVKYSACKDGKLRCVWTGEMFDEFVVPKQFDAVKRIPLIVHYLKRWLTCTNLLMTNAPFDINQTFISMGVELKNNLLVDLGLLLHVLDENERSGLKQAAIRYQDKLGINAHAVNNHEKKEMDTSIVENGGKPGMVWRAQPYLQMKYGCADAFLMFGIYEIAIEEFIERFGERGLVWFFEQEVMPVCKEVVIDMKRRGVYVDVPYFKKLYEENTIKMHALEDELIEIIAPHLANFTLGKSVGEAVSHQRVVKKIIELEGLSIPKVTDKKTGEVKESLAKAAVKKEFEANPHWVWGYILGEDELKYSAEKMAKIKNDLYVEVEGKRYRFNCGSRDHLTWLFCDQLGMNAAKLPQTDSATKENIIPSMDVDTLKEFMLPKHPWVAKLLTYRKLLKLQSTYILPAIELSIDGWLYMDMKQNGTTSGRFSCSGGYNLQTLPRVDDEMEILESCDKCHSKNVEIKQELMCIADRHCKDCGYVLKDITRPSTIKQGFIAPPGYKIVNADYSSLEPRCFAFVSGEEKLKEVYWADLDLYSKVYCDIFDYEKQYSADPKAPNFLKKVAKAKRTWIKPVVLGIPYGAEDAQVANLIGAKTEKKNWKGEILYEDGKPVMVDDVKEGKRVRDAYLSTYSKLNQYMADQDLKAVTFGYVETIVGRRRHLPFAKKINEVLASNGIDWKDLAQAQPWMLRQGKEAVFKSKDHGNEVHLTEAMFEAIREKIKFKEESARENGWWAYIRGMLKGDLNNAKNNPIQGLAGHITNKGMLDTNRKNRAIAIDAWVCLQVHDEITQYAKVECADQAAKNQQDGMEKNEFTALLDVAMIAEPVICDNLKESK